MIDLSERRRETHAWLRASVAASEAEARQIERRPWDYGTSFRPRRTDGEHGGGQAGSFELGGRHRGQCGEEYSHAVGGRHRGWEAEAEYPDQAARAPAGPWARG